MYINENLNPNKLKTGDCVIRAIAKATSRDWFQVHAILSQISRYLATSQTSKETSNYFLDFVISTSRCEIYKLQNKKRKRLTVKDISEKFKEGTFIVRTAGHIVCVQGGNYYDTWDCGNKCAYIIWRVK